MSLADSRPSFPRLCAGLWRRETNSYVPCLPLGVAGEKPRSSDSGKRLSHGHQRPQAGGTTSAWGAGEGNNKEAVELGSEGQGGAPRQAKGKWPQQRQRSPQLASW